MKKVIIYLSVLLMGVSSVAFAQDDSSRTTGQAIKHDAKKAGHAIKKGAQAVGNKTAELGVKGAAIIADKSSDSKMGPNGQTIYVTKDSRYYWVDKKGGRHFVKENDLKDKM